MVRKNFSVAKLRYNFLMVFVLIFAFLNMQTASAHIHLAEHHDHDEIHHHQAEGHSHYLVSHFSESDDLTHHADASNSVDLDSSFNAPSGKIKAPDLAISPSCFQQKIHIRTVRLELPFSVHHLYSHLHQSTSHPRAPPYFS